SITIDMNAGYVNVIKEIFPQAKIIIDRFHLVQLITRSMNKTRVRVMNTFKNSNGEDMKKYRRLKRYWKLLLKNDDELTHLEYKQFSLIGQRTDAHIIQERIAYTPDLHPNYILYPTLLRRMRKKSFDDLQGISLNIKTSDLSSYMTTSIKSLKTHLY